MDLLSVIRRWSFRDQLPIRDIDRVGRDKERQVNARFTALATSHYLFEPTVCNPAAF